jgi:hypothetical protein
MKRRVVAAVAVACAIGVSAPIAQAMPQSYIDSLPSCDGTGGVVPLKPANCKLAVAGWKVGPMRSVGRDKYEYGYVTCPVNYPINLASRDDPGVDRVSSRDITGAELHYYISETDNTNWLQRTNRYIVNGAGPSGVSIGVTGEWSSEGGGHHNLNPWSVSVVCHSDGEFGR